MQSSKLQPVSEELTLTNATAKKKTPENPLESGWTLGYFSRNVKRLKVILVSLLNAVFIP